LLPEIELKGSKPSKRLILITAVNEGNLVTRNFIEINMLTFGGIYLYNYSRKEVYM